MDLLLNIAKKLNELILKEEDKIPYSMNLIDELHINENAHSRILNVLLRYNKQGRYPIFESFIEHIFNNSICDVQHIKIDSPIFSCEEERIDLLIKEIDKYGIIIENKVQGALDQDKQLERYIDSIERFGLSHSKIYVLYLTKDGSKDVNVCSLTDKAKEALDYETEYSRFIAINYKDHILPWLEDMVLPTCQLKESLLISAITQYIDYLKGCLGLRTQQLIAQSEMNKFVAQELKIDSVKDAIEINTNLTQLKDTVENIIQEMINTIAQERILEPLNKYVEQFECKVDFKACSFSNYNTFSIRIINSNWRKCVILFNLEGSGLLYGICHLDADMNHIDDNQNSQIKELMSEFHFKQSLWWPCWKQMHKSYAPDGHDYWIKVNSGEMQVVDYLQKCFDEVYLRTKDFQL